MRDRLVEATYEVIARRGLARTTVEDVARQAGVGRATVYRHVPGGRDELVRAAIVWATDEFFLRLAEAVVDADDLAEVLERGLRHAVRAVREHALLQRLLATEPGLLLPTLTIEADRLGPPITAFLRPWLHRADLRPGVDVEEAADYLAHLLLSHVHAPGSWDLDDPGEVAELVRSQFLAGLVTHSGVTDVTPGTLEQ